MPYKDIEVRRKYHRDYAQKHRDKAITRAEDWRQENPEANWKWYLKNRYGVDKKKYQELLEQQDGVCAICHKAQAERHKRFKYLSVDHCHKTGVVRGLLCSSCNLALGLLDDDADALLRARDYVLKHKEAA